MSLPTLSDLSVGKVRPVQLLHILWLGPIALFLAACVVALAMIVRTMPPVQEFLAAFPGETPPPAGAPEGFPAWLQWQHFLNSLFILMLIKTGWQVRAGGRPAGFWSPKSRGGQPRRISLTVLLHLVFDVLFILNGVVFFVLLFTTGQWMRIVPTTWEVVPNALSAALQYASLDWPYENGWVNYNSLQLLAYFVTVFIAAPLAVITGIRMSPLWPEKSQAAAKVFPIGWARAVHFPVMLYFVLFTLVHVTLVLATGALRNLNHMYAGRTDETWWGAAIFGASVLVMIAVWLLARPIVIAPIASLFGKVSR